jgi:hypothetical protein
MIKSLLIVDDAKIRQIAFKETAKLIQKLDKLEANIQSFYEEDQQRFNEWEQLTFQKHKLRISNLQEKMADLSCFHNWIVATSRMERVSMPEAYLLMKKEREAYENGNPEIRARINEKRAARDQYISDQIAEEGRADEEFDYDDFEDDDFDGLGDDDTNNPFGPDDRTDAQRRQIEYLHSLSDRNIRQRCRTRESAFELLSSVMYSAGGDPKGIALILRIWDLIPSKHQQFLSKSFREDTGQSLKDVMAAFRELLEELAAEDSNDAPPDAEYNPDLDSESAGASQGQYRATGPRASAIKLPGEVLEKVKVTYRKLVRLLHPDLQGQEVRQSESQKALWMRVQQAYKNNDLQELELLLCMVLVRSNKLNWLSFSEIKSGHARLQQEFSRLDAASKSLKKLPAWGFSRKKNFDSLTSKIENDYSRIELNILEEVEDLESQHALMDLLANQPQRHPRKRSQSRKKAKKVPAKKRSTSDRQFDLF